MTNKVCVCSLRTEISCTGRSVIRHSHLHRENPRSTVPNTFRRFKFDGNPLQCWNCRSRDAAKQLFCSRCKVLQRPEKSSTYFDIIGVAPTYNVALSELTSRYRKLQSSLHPDRFSNSSEPRAILVVPVMWSERPWPRPEAGFTRMRLRSSPRSPRLALSPS
uniref:(California timema) hypothetical protein n=1 Tax=Timema californicum TaxID=61474 RepID=A0A7R9JI86_TIMCA|nr:unnamed protein product [Timema californicum]